MGATQRVAKPSLSLLLGAVVLAATVGGTLVLAGRDEGKRVAYRLTKEVAAFHVIAADDVEIATVDQRSDAEPATSVVGRLMLRKGRTGKTLFEADLGSTPPSGAIIPGGKIMGIPATAAQAMSGRLEQGSRILLTTSESPHESLDATLLDLVATTNGGDRPYVIVVAVVKASDSQLSQMAKGQVAVSVPAVR